MLQFLTLPKWKAWGSSVFLFESLLQTFSLRNAMSQVSLESDESL